MNVKVNESILPHIQVVDIRSKREWRSSGVVPGSLCHSFFDDNGLFDTDEFINEISKTIDISKEVGIICRSGRRSAFATQELRAKGIDAINLDGGIEELKKIGYELVDFEG